LRNGRSSDAEKFQERPVFWFCSTTALEMFELIRLLVVHRGRVSAPTKFVLGGARLALM
jgi:hypothetical protein